MDYEDKTLTCVECGASFVFSAGEQEFFAERGLNSPPKRCKACRKKRKKRSNSGGQGNDGTYRSPSFENSAPDHQKIRGRRGRGGRRQGAGPADGRNRSQAASRGKGQRQGRGYRSPAFGKNEIRPEDEYRAPGFREYAGIVPEDEYRAPGFRNDSSSYTDEKPMFSLICPVCGKEALVPFLPEEKENPMCPECYKLHRASEDGDSEGTEPSA